MRLRYDTAVSADAKPLVLIGPQETRVEIHLREEPDASASLLAFSGLAGGQPQKTVQQGPYQTLDQAIAAKRAIAAQLKDAGFAQSEQHPLWSLNAQRNINSQRVEKQRSAVDYRFDPKDVFLDW
jgi:hypothetical protein